MTNVFLSRKFPGVNPVAMNYKIRHNKDRPANGHTIIPLLFVVEKMENTVWRCEATCKCSYRGKFAHAVCELARALVNHGWSMNIIL